MAAARIDAPIDPIQSEIIRRNETIEQHPAWISAAYQDFMVKNLDEIPDADYGRYARYLDNGTLHVVVHPAYYVFFHGNETYWSNGTAVDAFLREPAASNEAQFLKEQERAVRDFLETASTTKKLVLVVLPGNYRDYRGYVYKGQSDEFARYVNSVTNQSDSVLYVYSDKPYKGSLGDLSKRNLSKFLTAVNPAQIKLGGGYLGRCVADFYRDAAEFVGESKVSIASEISAFSPEDLAAIGMNEFVLNGKIDVGLMQAIIASSIKRENSLKDVINNFRNNRNRKG
jgi:hypothetical protein